MPQKLFVIFALLISASIAAAQNATEPKKADESDKLREKAVEFLRETSGDVGRMRSMENRISFSAELASLMWFHDAKEAKAMYALAIGDFKQLLAQFDAQLNTLEAPIDEEYSGGIFGGYGRSPVERKFRIAMMVRQQIAMSVAEHDAELAYSFFYESAGLITNAKFRAENERSDKAFEFQLMKQIAETNAAEAAKFATGSLKDGVENNHLDLLKKIYAKDVDKGVDFGQAILSRIKSDRKSVGSPYVFSGLLSFGSENLEASKKTGGKKAIYSREDLRDIAEQFAQVVLAGEDGAANHFGVEFAEQIERFVPGRGAQIRAKYKSPGSNANRASFSMTDVATTGSYGGPPANSNSAPRNPDAEQRELAEKKMAEDVKSLGKSLPKEERDKIVAQARKIISQTPGKEKKIVGLSLLAGQVARAGDKDLADEIMRDADRLVNPQPKNYQDFLFSWMLASGYAESNPDKAFPILEDVIMRANDTISAFVKVAEFIDVNEEMIDDGEVQVGMFGGSMVRAMTKELGMADSTLISLARADFAKTRALTNGFDRIEIRVLAKMMVLRVCLEDKKPSRGEEELKDEVGLSSKPRQN